MDQGMSFTQMLGLGDEGSGFGMHGMPPPPPLAGETAASLVDPDAPPWKRLVAPSGTAVAKGPSGQVQHVLTA